MNDKNQEEKTNKDEKKDGYKPTAGQSFVKMIGPIGSIIFLLMFVFFLIFCFTGGGF